MATKIKPLSQDKFIFTFDAILSPTLCPDITAEKPIAKENAISKMGLAPVSPAEKPTASPSIDSATAREIASAADNILSLLLSASVSLPKICKIK